MLKGTVAFRAGIRGNGITFPKFEFNPNQSGVDKLEMEGPDGDHVCCVVHLASVGTSEQGKALAATLSTAALDRMAVFHGVAIGPAQITDGRFYPLVPTPGVLSAEPGELVITGEAIKCCIGIPSAQIQAELEEVSPTGESYFGLYRSARQSASPVEEFMHLYHVLLMLFGDNQAQVDGFVRRELPSVPQTQDPRPNKQGMETVFTRLRNEFAHRRVGASVENTKVEMTSWVDSLAALTARAIRSHP